MGISSQVNPGLSNKVVEVGKSASVPYLLIRDAVHRKMHGTKLSCKTNVCQKQIEVESFLFSGKFS